MSSDQSEPKPDGILSDDEHRDNQEWQYVQPTTKSGVTHHHFGGDGDDDWEEYEVVDVKTGKSVEDRTFGSTADAWAEYDEGVNRPVTVRTEAPAPTPVPVARRPEPSDRPPTPTVQAAPRLAPPNGDAVEASLMQQAAVLRMRGMPLTIVRSAVGRYGVIYDAGPQACYLVCSNRNGGYRVLQRRFHSSTICFDRFDLMSTPKDLNEVLAVIDHHLHIAANR